MTRQGAPNPITSPVGQPWEATMPQGTRAAGEGAACDVLSCCYKTKYGCRSAQPFLHQFSPNHFALSLESSRYGAPVCLGSRRDTGNPDHCIPCQWGSAPHSHAPSSIWGRWSQALLAHLAHLAHLPHFSAGEQLRGQQTFSRLESKLFFSLNSCKKPCLSFFPFLFTRCHQDGL